MIYNQRSYTTINSGLVMTVVKIYYQNDKHIKFKGILSNKLNGYVYETKNYKLPKERISHWIDTKIGG